MRKIGIFLMGFLPFLFAVGAQFLAEALMSGAAMLSVFIVRGNSGSALSEFYTLLTNTDFSVGIMMIYAVICICCCGLYYYSSCGGTYTPGLKVFHPLKLTGIVLLVPGMQFLSGCIVQIICVVMPEWYRQYESLIESAGGDELGLPMLCYSILLAPLCEELLFRGVTMRIYRRVLPFWMANFMQALLFGIFHMNWLQGIYAFVLGLVLGWICEKCGSIYYSLLFHILFNFWGSILSALFSGYDTALFSALYLFGCIASLILGALALRRAPRKFSFFSY